MPDAAVSAGQSSRQLTARKRRTIATASCAAARHTSQLQMWTQRTAVALPASGLQRGVSIYRLPKCSITHLKNVVLACLATGTRARQAPATCKCGHAHEHKKLGQSKHRRPFLKPCSHRMSLLHKLRADFEKLATGKGQSPPQATFGSRAILLPIVVTAKTMTAASLAPHHGFAVLA